MSFQIQHLIKRNAQQMRQYVTDLYDWQQQMDFKQKAKSKVLKAERQKEQQILKQIQKQQKLIQKPKNTQSDVKIDLVRDTNTVKDYYNAWDKFNVQKQLKKLQDQQSRQYRSYNPYEHSLSNIRAKPKAAMNICIHSQRAAILDPSQLKDKGNLHYKVCQYQKAVSCYSQCLQKLYQSSNNSQLKCIVLSNRAMTYMKLNQRLKALKDCNESLLCNPNYVKSYLRRADCHKKLGNYRESLKDFQQVKKLDHEDKAVEHEIKKIQMFLEKRFKQARNNLVIHNLTDLPSDTYRITIQEVDQVNTQKPKEKEQVNKPNYLEEL